MFFLKKLPSRKILNSYHERYSEMDIDGVEQALSELRSASILLRKLDAYFSSYGLSQTRFLVLILIDRETNGTGLTPIELADRLDVSKPVVSKTLKALVHEELLHARPHESDQRSRIFGLTPKGKDLLHTLLPGYYVLLAKHVRSDSGRKEIQHE
ncbi:MAG: MarR family transcriptional regulator [Pontiella sp.]